MDGGARAGRCPNLPERRGTRERRRAQLCREGECSRVDTKMRHGGHLSVSRDRIETRRGRVWRVILSIAMARTTTALVCLAAAFGVASAQVATLTASNFETEVVNGGKNAFVKFYAPWCASR